MSKEKNKEKFEKIANEILKPIIDKVYEVAFEYIETYKGDSDEPIKVPLAIKENIIETLDEVIKHCEDQAGFYDSASIIGYALGKDGSRPGQEYRHMIAIATAIRDLISAKNDQVKDELEYMRKQQNNARTASNLGF
jgi:hypothetical protein